MRRITSRANPWLKAVRALSEDAREVRRQGRALLEGIHLVDMALGHSCGVQSLIISESALAHAEIQRVLAKAGSSEVIELPDTLFRSISSVSSEVGIAALMTLPVSEVADALRDVAGDAVVLDAVQDAGNVGAILRTAAAAGVRQVIMGKGCAGAWTPRVLRAGQGAHFSLAIHEGIDLQAWMSDRPGMVANSVASVAHDGTDLYALNLAAPVVWLLGSEGAGLSPEVLALGARRATIPLASGTESLNVGAAAAVCLFEMRRQRRVTSADFCPG